MRRRRGLPHAGASARRRWGTGPAARHVQAPLREERRRCPRQAQRKSPASLLEGGALFQPLKRKRRSSALFQPGLPNLGDGGPGLAGHLGEGGSKSEAHTSELQALTRTAYAVFCLKKNNTNTKQVRAQ